MNSLKMPGLFILAFLCQNLVSGLPPMEHQPRADMSNVHYLLWTPANSGDADYYEVINGDDASLSNSPFDASLMTYFIAHGWNSDGLSGWIVDAKTNLLSLGPCNVISINWEVLANQIDYFSAKSDSLEVASFTATFLDFLVTSGGANIKMIEMAGHSLGAHLCGLASYEMSSGIVSRVTGLDPAGPGFYDNLPKNRLDSQDADFVDVIHTNGGFVAGSNYGMAKDIGHVDYYPNGGETQPGCLTDIAGCSHVRAHDFWLESILAGVDGNGETFQSWPCDSWDTFAAGGCTDCGTGCLNMGFQSERSLRGLFYLHTDKRSPYALGAAGN